MKNILFTAVLLFICLFSQAQRFEKYYGGPGADYGVDIAVLSDQSIVSVGTSNSYGHGGDDIVVTKTDSTGLLLWSRYFGGAYNDQGKAITVSTNDEIYVCGVLMGAVAGSEDILLAKITKDGKVLWTKTYGGTATDIVNDMVIMNNNIYMFGSTKSFGAGQDDMYFISTDTAGTVITTKTIGTTADDLGTCISKTADGNFLIGGRSNFNIASEVFAAKINTLGDTLWTKRFDCNTTTPVAATSFVTANAVIELSDKQILVTGLGVGNQTYFWQSFHIRLDSLGNTIYLNYYGNYTYNRGISAISTANGGYIISSDYGMMLNKYDKTGTNVWSKTYQNVYYGSGYQEGCLAGRIKNLPAGKILFTGTGFILNSTKDIYIARLDSNGVAYSTPDPIITAAGPISFCDGDSVLLSVPTGYITYQWIKFDSYGNKTFYPGNSNSFYAKETGGFICVMTKQTGTRITPFLSIGVTPYPTTTVSTYGATNFCAASGQTVTLTATSGYTSYQWYHNSVAIAGATANSYIADSSGNYTVSITNTCGLRTSTAVSLNAITPPTISLTCSGMDCNTYPCHYSDPLIVTNCGAGATYEWYLGGVLYSTTSTNTYSPSVNGGVYTCQVTTGCGTATSNSYIVSSNGSTNNTIQTTTPASGCGTGNSIVLTAPNTWSAFFQWYYNSNLISGATSSTYTATSSGSYSVSYQNASSNCPSTMSDPLQFYPDTNTIATITATAGTSACSGTLPLTVNISGTGVTYQWYLNNSTTVGYASTYQASVSGSYSCLVNRPSCGYEYTNSITVNIGGPAITTSNVSANLCQGSTKGIYVSPNSSFYTYQWNLNSTPITGATLSYYNATQPGIYICDVTNACGTVSSSPITVTQITVPTPIITAGSTIVCPGQTAALSTALITGDYYYWFIGNNYFQYGYNLDSINASQAGSYTVRVSDPNGCSSTSSPLILTTAPTPVAATPFAGDYPLICNGSPLLLKGTSYSNANYIWYKNNNVLAGAVDSFYNATNGGDYKYMVTNVCGTSTSPAINVISKAIPVATIIPLSSTSICNGDSVILQASISRASTYTWYKNNSIINNAVKDTYAAKQAGWYSTKVTSKFGCYKASSYIVVTVPCKTNDDTEVSEFNLNAIRLYPNPSDNIVYFEIPESSTDKKFQIAVYDTQGRILGVNISKVNDGLWMLSDLESGIYILKVDDGTATVSRTFVVMK